MTVDRTTVDRSTVDRSTVDSEVELAQRARRRQRRVVRAVGSLAAVVLILGATTVYIRRPAKTVTIDDAVARYRTAAQNQPAAADAATTSDTAATDPGAEAEPAVAAPTGGASAGAATPAPSSAAARPAPGAAPGQASGPRLRPPADGVYTYDTKGYEQVDALGGSRHDYPAQSALTVSHIPCGFVQKWQPLEERWDESEHCLERGGVSIRRFSTYHSFFQRGIRQDYPCPPGSMVYPSDPTPGNKWSLTCKGDAGQVVMAASVVGPEQLTIAGKSIRTIRVHYDATLTGANRGRQVQDRWFHPESGLNVRIDTEIHTESDSPFGVANYEEQYSITAASLTPRK